MDDVLVLSILKFAGLVVGLASVIWGMVTRTTVDTEDGQKRLTRAGHVSIALAVGSFVVAACAHGFETLAKRAQSLEAEAKAEREAREKTLSRLLDVTTLQELQLSNSEQRVADLEAAEATTRQRLLTLSIAAADQLRDAAISQGINRESGRNLSRTGQALTQLQRLLQPLEGLQARVVWEFPGDHPLVIASTARIRELVQRLRDDPALAQRLPGIRWDGEQLTLYRASGFYPSLEHERPFANAVQGARAVISMFAEANAAAGVRSVEEAADTDVPLDARGDLRLDLRDERYPILFYEARSGTVSFQARMAANSIPERSDAIRSVPDLERSVLLVESLDNNARLTGLQAEIRALRATLRPRTIEIIVSGRMYSLPGPRFRRIYTAAGLPVYVVDRVGSPLNR